MAEHRDWRLEISDWRSVYRMIRVIFDETVDILVIRFREGDYEESDEVTEGVIVDFDKEGKPMAIEILDASHVLGEMNRVMLEYSRIPQKEAI
jgi:uncharacterized protein YuzE